MEIVNSFFFFFFVVVVFEVSAIDDIVDRSEIVEKESSRAMLFFFVLFSFSPCSSGSFRLVMINLDRRNKKKGRVSPCSMSVYCE